ncbi:MAG: hypothetical protein ABGX16_06970 [Pirellulales bacterium]
MAKLKSPFEPPNEPDVYLHLLGEYAQKKVDELCSAARGNRIDGDSRFISGIIRGKLRRYRLKSTASKKQGIQVDASRAVALLSSISLAQKVYEELVDVVGEEMADRVFEVVHDLGKCDALEGLNGRDYQGFCLEMGRSKGGKASKKLTAQQENLALKILHEMQGPRLSKTGDCKRAADKLKNRYGIYVSNKTLSRIWDARGK